MANYVTSGWKSADPVLPVFGSDDRKEVISNIDATVMLNLCLFGINAVRLSVMNYCCGLYSKTGRSLLANHHTLCGRTDRYFHTAPFPDTMSICP